MHQDEHGGDDGIGVLARNVGHHQIEITRIALGAATYLMCFHPRTTRTPFRKLLERTLEIEAASLSEIHKGVAEHDFPGDSDGCLLAGHANAGRTPPLKKRTRP
jgi:hypothetical protein